VIFVPGIMGSTLRDLYPTDPELVWSPLKLLLNNYDRITLHPNDVRYELQEPARVVADQVFGICYSELIEELRHNLSPDSQRQVPVYPLAYDWRQPLEQTQLQLRQLIEEVQQRTRLLRHYRVAGYGTVFPALVSVVTHSMGGLVIAGYVSDCGWDSLDKVATIAAPFRGSVEAVTKVATGVGGLGQTSGSSREREMARLTPSLYYLLPDYPGAVLADPGMDPNLFHIEAWQPGILQSLADFVRRQGVDVSNPDMQARALLQQMLQQAQAYRQKLERLQLTDSRKWLCVVGVGEQTRVRLRIVRDENNAPWFDFIAGDLCDNWNMEPHGDFTGDNTVPYAGSSCAFIPANEVVCLSPAEFGFWELRDRLLERTGFHSALPNMNLAQRLVISHLLGQEHGVLNGHPAPGVSSMDWRPPSWLVP
jgi:hypothetical protein